MLKKLLVLALMVILLAACNPSDSSIEPTLAPLSQVEMDGITPTPTLTLTSTAAATATTMPLAQPTRSTVSQQFAPPTATPLPTQQQACEIDFLWTEDYRVQAGDTLESIAQKIGRTPSEIMRANCMTSATVREGQLLRLPYQGEMAVVTFTVSTTPVVPNQIYTVVWEVSNAASVTLRRDRWNTTISTQGAPDIYENLPASGQVQYTAGLNSFSEIIILVAYDRAGKWIRQDKVVTVSAPPAAAPEIVFFAGSPEVMDAGGSINLNWEVKGADHITLFPWNTPRRPSSWNGGVNVSSVGPHMVHIPPDYRETSMGFTLIASSNIGQTVERDFILQIRPVPLQLYTVLVSVTEARPGDTITITWESSGSTFVRISDANVSPTPQIIADNLPTSGSHPVTIPAHYTGQVTYIVSAWDSTGINPSIQSVTVILK